tara:strand:+ start:332 stop:1903 length:1572 start_codon:yes stop_codon:yes gene_type:complete
MKKKLSYRDKLLELSRIYNVKEIQEYIRRRKNLTSGQIELILRKNKIIIPKDFKTNFFKENISKPLSRVSRRIDDIKEDSTKAVNRVSRKISYFKEDSSRSFFSFFYNLWRSIGNIGLRFLSLFSSFFYNTWKLTGNAGLGFLNVIPKLGQTYYSFFSDFFTNLFHGIYSQQLNKGKAGRFLVGFFIIAGLITVIVSAVTTFNNFEESGKNEIVKKEKQIQKPKVEVKKEVKKPKPKVQKEVKKPKVKSKTKKKEKVAETILPDLNLKTETVLNLFKDVDYNLNQVRYEKIIKPIYFTQFPKDLDAIQSSKLKKETFIKIVLPLIVAENEKILYDRNKLKKITSKKQTTGQEKQWLRQKFLEYKVKKGGIQELEMRMDIIPNSLALAQAAKESGWGTSRFALEGNAIFGQWTWDGSGIAPLNRDKSKNHKILKFPILRASVKAYQNNLNTHKSYIKFREKRRQLREKNKDLNGLELSKTLSNYAQTGSEYIKILAKIIIQNRLMDFEPVRLAHSVKKKQELNL